MGDLFRRCLSCFFVRLQHRLGGCSANDQEWDTTAAGGKELAAHSNSCEDRFWFAKLQCHLYFLSNAKGIWASVMGAAATPPGPPSCGRLQPRPCKGPPGCFSPSTHHQPQVVVVILYSGICSITFPSYSVPALLADCIPTLVSTVVVGP
jgi:hypothetical protein